MELMLASASPRRSELLASLGLHFSVTTGPPIDEVRLLEAASGTWPQRLCQLALAKGGPVAEFHPQHIVLSADTEVLLDGQALGKPADRGAAVSMLLRLAGRTHTVCTAIAVQRWGLSLSLSAAEETEVEFIPLAAGQASAYVDRVQPFDFAGGYAIQGLGAMLVKRIGGDYSNVVGLPLRLTAQLLEQAGLPVL